MFHVEHSEPKRSPKSETPAHNQSLFRVEGDGVLTLSVKVTKKGAIPPSERKESYGGGYSDFDSNHANLNLREVLAGSLATAGEMEVALPKGDLFTRSIALDKLPIRMADSTGPRISSWAIAVSGVTRSKTVSARENPPTSVWTQRPSDTGAAPSATPFSIHLAPRLWCSAVTSGPISTSGC